MIVSKAYHEDIVSSFRQVLSAKDRQLASVEAARNGEVQCLKEEVAFLRGALSAHLPQRHISFDRAENISIENDAILSGHQEQIERTPLTEREEFVLAERDRILSGEY